MFVERQDMHSFKIYLLNIYANPKCLFSHEQMLLLSCTNFEDQLNKSLAPSSKFTLRAM